MAANGVDVPRLDQQIEDISPFGKFCGGYADIYTGVWLGGRAFWTAGKAISGRNVAVAIKVFRDVHNKTSTPEGRQKYEKLLNNEYRVCALLCHPNVLPVFGFIKDPAIPSMGIVAPRCTFGDLRAFLSDPTRPSSINRFAIVKGIAEGLKYLHGEKVVHGDLTMGNVLIELIDGVVTPLISDFGRSRVLEIKGYTSSFASVVQRHLPPEILLADDENRTTKAFTQPADVWCFGMVMLETFSGKPPFFYLNEFQAAMAVGAHGKIPDKKRYPPFPHDDACWQIMGQCWHGDPSRRMKMSNLLEYLNTIR